MEDADLPIAHQLVAAVIKCNLGRVNAILDAHEDLDLNALPGAALVYRPPGADLNGPLFLSSSGSILHVATSHKIPVISLLAFAESMEAILARLLRAGASPHSTDYSGYTPLHWACEMASEWAIRPLLAHGAPVNALDNDGSTPLHKLFKLFRREGCSCVRVDALGSLLEPMLAAGADPTVPRKLDGLRPYDMLSRIAHYGPVAVLALRDGVVTLEAFSAGQLVSGSLIVPGLPPIAVSHTLRELDPRPARPEQGPARPEQGPEKAGRWRLHVAHLEERARRLDEQRRAYTRVALQLLLWRQRAAAASGDGHPVGALPEELLFAILLRACPDHGQRAALQLRFEAVAAHLAVANLYERRSAALAAWLSSTLADEHEEVRLQQLSEEYDAATAKLKQLRALKSKDEHAHGKAVRAVDAFVRAAKGVLYGELCSEGEDDDGGDMDFDEAEE